MTFNGRSQTPVKGFELSNVFISLVFGQWTRDIIRVNRDNLDIECLDYRGLIHSILNTAFKCEM